MAPKPHAITPVQCTPRGFVRRGERLRLFATAVAVGAACAIGPASAVAEQPNVTMQARTANAEFLAFAPPPPGGSAGVCLVDTGVDLNPDTEGIVVGRLALDDGGPDDVHHGKHGTSMAMTMGAPVNDWGGVGAWPHVRIFSIRAMPAGEAAFPFHYYTHGVQQCRKNARSRNLMVVNLALGGSDGSQSEIDSLRDDFLSAQAGGLNVVAAAGNGGGAVEYPGAIPEAFTAGGANERGILCSFSGRGEGVDVIAPGCGLDVGLPDGRPGRGDGTSDSAAFTSAVLAALRSYRADLTPAAAEELLTATARPTSTGPLLDVEAAFRAAGLGDVVDAGTANVPNDPSPGDQRTDGAPSQGPAEEVPGRGVLAQRLPQPRLGYARLRGNRLTLRLRNRPPYAQVVAELSYDRGRGEFRHRERTIRRNSSILRLRLPRGWSRITLEYRDLELAPSRRLTLTKRALLREYGSNRRRRTR